MGEHIREVYDIGLFYGFENYSKNREEMANLVEVLYAYLKLSGELKYFEYCNYRQPLGDYDDIDYEEEIEEDEDVEKVYTSWVLFGFNDIYKRNIDFGGDDEDLFIAIDVFEDGRAKMRIQFPDHRAEKFNEHYRRFDDEVRGSFSSEKQDDFVNYIKILMEVL